MIPPLISYVTFNRLGLTIGSLSSILESTDDFELHIIDNFSNDGTWEYIQGLSDPRIKSRSRIDINAGQVYALNLNLLKRRPEQYFITVDNDVCIRTKDWITRFLKVFETFPEVGLLGVQSFGPHLVELPQVTSQVKGGVFYLKVDKAFPDPEQSFIPGRCMCLRPELLNIIGYWSEENCFGDIEISNRVNNYTDYTTGFVTGIKIEMPQKIECSDCGYQSQCILDQRSETCFTDYTKYYKNDEFKKKFRWKFEETLKDLKSGARPVYCASSNDGYSLSNHIFNMEWAVENFNFYIKNAN
ncbi:MAG: glycosyltransferase [Firmicutes bacterium]|nr:glycosyltransferase [Bacillota bacterium]